MRPSSSHGLNFQRASRVFDVLRLAEQERGMNVNVTMPCHQASPDRYGAHPQDPRQDRQSAKGLPAQGEHEEYGCILIGDVGPWRPAKTEMAKTEMANGTLDASLAGLRHMTSHQALTRAACVLSQRGLHDSDLSSVRCAPWPQRYRRCWNKAGLGISCCEFGVVHLRDRNSATSILPIGVDTPCRRSSTAAAGGGSSRFYSSQAVTFHSIVSPPR
jgi:hypothetical protein